jgi:diacylglycerol kinase family enzyme
VRAELAREARSRGWKVVELSGGDDYPEVDSAACEHAPEVVAFAGADRAQSKATVVASGRELSYACVPAGRDDLFARDLGLDPEVGLGAVGAAGGWCEYYVDLAEVNGVAFVNYVALGLACTPVRARPGHRREPRLFASDPSYTVAPHQPPARLHWYSSSGRERCVGLFVSNNRRRFEASAIGGRARLDGGVLGVGVLTAAHNSASALERRKPWHQLDMAQFEVDSSAPLRADVDGRARLFEPPLRFRILPRALRVRIPLPD